MHKIRKSSLSPCYANSNKENLPIENLTSPIGISFKNLEQARKKKTIQPTPAPTTSTITKMSINQQLFKQASLAQQPHKPSISPCGHQPNNPRQHSILESGRQESNNNKSIDDYRSSLKSKEKQMSSLHNQVSTLNCTVTLLKEQANNLKQENLVLNKENAQCKRLLKEKNQIIDKLRKQRRDTSPIGQHQTPTHTNNISTTASTKKVTEECQKCQKYKKQQQDYQEVIQKLNELEQVQNKLLFENEKLSKKEAMHMAMIRNFKTLMQGNRLQELSDLINVLNQ